MDDQGLRCAIMIAQRVPWRIGRTDEPVSVPRLMRRSPAPGRGAALSRIAPRPVNHTPIGELYQMLVVDRLSW